MDTKRPSGVTVIIIVNIIASVITIIFWYLVSRRLFGSNGNQIQLDKFSAGSTFGFMIADIIFAVPVLIISIPGLRKMRFYGWTAAQMANILWLYSLTAVLIRDLYSSMVSPGSLLFLPFALFSVWGIIYLWKKREIFFRISNPVAKKI